MTTREKIIVAIMCLTIVYGAYELLFARKSGKPVPASVGNPIGELKSFVTEIGQKLNSEQKGKESPYIITRAGATWDKDPFIHSTGPLQKRLTLGNPDQQQKPAADRPDFIYSGYMQLGTMQMVIINGMEYTVGESLTDKSFYVKSIAPQQVVIGKTTGLETIQLPIREFDSGSVE